MAKSHRTKHCAFSWIYLLLPQYLSRFSLYPWRAAAKFEDCRPPAVHWTSPHILCLPSILEIIVLLRAYETISSITWQGTRLGGAMAVTNRDQQKILNTYSRAAMKPHLYLHTWEKRLGHIWPRRQNNFWVFARAGKWGIRAKLASLNVCGWVAHSLHMAEKKRKRVWKGYIWSIWGNGAQDHDVTSRVPSGKGDRKKAWQSARLRVSFCRRRWSTWRAVSEWVSRSTNQPFLFSVFFFTT